MLVDMDYRIALGAMAAAGLLYCFLGYRLFKLVLGLTGFALAGAVAGVLVAWLTRGNPTGTLIGVLIGGLCGAMALFFLYRAGVFCLGFLAALIVAYELLHTRPETWAPWAIVGVALAGGLFALLIERPAMTLATAAIGAWLCAYAASLVLWGEKALERWTDIASIHGMEWGLLVLWGGLTLVGAAFQLGTTRKRKEQEE